MHIDARRKRETPEEADARRVRESLRVEERVVSVDTVAAFEAAMAHAANKLVVIEVDSERVCQTGLDEEVELQWKEDAKAALEPCTRVKHTFARTARDCPDSLFLAVNADDEEAGPLLQRLGVECLPTVQFWRRGTMLWERRGVIDLESDLGDGVLYYGDTAAGGVHASDHVSELRTPADFDAFIAPSPTEEGARALTVVDVSLEAGAGCIRVFPAVLALARSFKGFAKFGRLIADASPEASEILRRYRVVEAPTFLFFKNGVEVGRHVGSSRGDLIGRILEVQMAHGVAPPPPPPRARPAAKAGGRVRARR